MIYNDIWKSCKHLLFGIPVSCVCASICCFIKELAMTLYFEYIYSLFQEFQYATFSCGTKLQIQVTSVTHSLSFVVSTSFIYNKLVFFFYWLTIVIQEANRAYLVLLNFMRVNDGMLIINTITLNVYVIISAFTRV